MTDNPDAAEHEELLWSMGVGSRLPDWLQELRRRERTQGLNQAPRSSSQTRARPGIAATCSWEPGAGSSESKLPTAPSTAASSQLPSYSAPQERIRQIDGGYQASPDLPSSSASQSFAPPVTRNGTATAATVVTQSFAPPITQSFAPHVSPHGVGPPTEADKHKSLYSDFRSDAHIQNDSLPARTAVAPVTMQTYASTGAQPSGQHNMPVSMSLTANAAVAPTLAQELVGQIWNGSVKEWLECLDEAGFFVAIP